MVTDNHGNRLLYHSGPDKYLNSTRIPVYGSHAPAGTSIKNMVHWNQMYVAKRPQVRLQLNYLSLKSNQSLIINLNYKIDVGLWKCSSKP